MKFKNAITAIDGNMNISSRETSNNYGSAFIWSGNLDAPISFRFDDEIEDTAYLYWRADNREQPTGINFYGGFTDQAEKAFTKIFNAKKLVSLKYNTHWITKKGDYGDIGTVLNKRKDVPQHIKDKAKEIDWKSIPTIKDTDFEFTTITIGNSHTPSFADHNSIVVKTDGTTLNSQLVSDFKYVRDHISAMPLSPKKVTMTFCDIDLRFYYLNRDKFGDNLPNWQEAIDKWFAFGEELTMKYGCDVEYAAPLPVETEERKHPKTGAYPKGSEIYFYGSAAERRQLSSDILDYMILNTPLINHRVVHVPFEWYNMDPKEYEVTKMEKPRSVHLGPHVYRRNNWGEPKVEVVDGLDQLQLF